MKGCLFGEVVDGVGLIPTLKYYMFYFCIPDFWVVRTISFEGIGEDDQT